MSEPIDEKIETIQALRREISALRSQLKKQMGLNERLWKVSDVTAKLGITPLTVRELFKSGEIRAFKTKPTASGRWRTTRKDVNDYIDRLRGISPEL